MARAGDGKGAGRIGSIAAGLDTGATHYTAGYDSIFPAQAPLRRTAMNSWDDPAFVDTVVNLGRTRLILAGLWTETCVALPAIQALADGFEVYVVEYCCGDISHLAHDNAMQRMIQAGARQHTGAHEAMGDYAAAPVSRPPQPVYPGYVSQAAE